MATNLCTTEAQRADWLRQVTAAMCRESFAEFVKESWDLLESGELEWTEFQQAQCDTLQAFGEDWLAANGKANAEQLARVRAHWNRHGMRRKKRALLVQDLIVNGFPGSLKSRLVMVLFPAWMWLHDPTFTIAATSGTGDNVTRDSNAHKEVVSSRWYRETFDITWKVGVNRAGDVVDSTREWWNSAGGYRLSKKLFSSWQGVHVDFLAIDDPDDAMKVWDEPIRLRTRKKCRAIRNRTRHPTRSIRCLVQQRVHPEDVTGDRLQKGTWSPDDRGSPAVLSISLEYRAARRCTTPYGWTDPRTTEHEVVHPERYTADFINAERKEYGKSGFEAQYNQNPGTTEGGWYGREFWRWFRFDDDDENPRPRPDGCSDPAKDKTLILRRRKDRRPDVDTVALSVDASFGSLDEETASGVGLTVYGIDAGRRFGFFDDSKPRTYTETEDRIVELIKEWWVDEVLVEAKAQGTAVVSRLKKLMEEAKLVDRNGRPIVVKLVLLETEGGKGSRGRAAQPTVENGLIYLHEGAPWVEPWVEEVSGFPKAHRDDRFDDFTQMVIYYEDHMTVEEETAAYDNMGAALGVR